jgi:hypothetical protein
MLRRSGLIGRDGRNVHSDKMQGRSKELEHTSKLEASLKERTPTDVLL